MRLAEIFDLLEQPWGQSPLDLLTKPSGGGKSCSNHAPLVRAVRAGSLEAVTDLVVMFKLCCRQGLAPGLEANNNELASFVNAMDERGWTALTHAAAVADRRAVVVLLVEKCGADASWATAGLSDTKTAVTVSRTIEESLAESKLLKKEMEAKEKKQAADAAAAAAAAADGGPAVVIVDDSAVSSDDGGTGSEESFADVDDNGWSQNLDDYTPEELRFMAEFQIGMYSRGRGRGRSRGRGRGRGRARGRGRGRGRGRRW